MRSTIIFIIAVAAAVVVPAFGCRQQEAESPSGTVVRDDQLPEPAAVAMIEPGTRINAKALPDRTHLVFRSQPKLTSGNVKKVGKLIRDALENFTTLVLIETEPDPNRPGRFRRGPYRIGIGMPGDTGDVVVTKDSAKELGISLGAFERKVLGEREKEISTVRSPGASPTMAMFDFTMTFVRDERRVPIVVRYLSLVDPENGDVVTAYWVLDVTADGYRFFGDSLWVMPPNHVMDWEMDVDGGKVTFGAPHSDAFASTRLPQGTARTVPAEFQGAAAARSFTAESGSRLEQQVRDLLNDRRR